MTLWYMICAVTLLKLVHVLLSGFRIIVRIAIKLFAANNWICLTISTLIISQAYEIVAD